MISALDVFVNRVKIKIQISVFTRIMYVESVVIIGIQHIARRGGLTMAEININDLKKYDFENAQKGDIVVVATINYDEFQSFEMCSVKSVSPKKGDVKLDNGLKYSKDGYEYGRRAFCLIYHRVFVDNEETRETANSYMAQKNIARKIMVQIQKINTSSLMKTTNDKCRRLSLVLDEILEAGE